MKNFVLIGAAGYVAPKHMRAIKDVGGNLVAALDPHDSVGILDSYFPECRFFTEFERFDRFCAKLIDRGQRVDYVSICSPNYLHDAHCRFALRIGADAICEKPLVLTAKNLTALKKVEDQTGRKVYTILQLRLNPQLIELKTQLETVSAYDTIRLQYVTPRGCWYDYSWKGDVVKSGGIATNIGIHLFDMMCWFFGTYRKVTIVKREARTVSGIVFFENRSVHFHLSVDGRKACRTISSSALDLKIEFSNGFTDLHARSYENILAGDSFGIDDIMPATMICEQIRNGA